MITAETIIEIPFFDVDSMNIVWHGNYVKYLEVARCDLLNKVGYNYLDMSNSGYAWPVTTVKLKYIAPCVFMQKILITSTLEEYENRIKVKYTITDAATGKVLSKAETVQMAVDIKTMETCFLSPQVFIDKVEKYLAK